MSGSSRRCWRPRSSPATLPALATGSPTPLSQRTKPGGFQLHYQPRRRAADLAPRPAGLGPGAHERLLLRPTGTGKTHLATALAIRACHAGHRVAFATAQQWIDRLETAQHRNGLRRRAQAAWSATGSSSSTRSATCRSNDKPPTCSPRSSRAATHAARSSSPQTAASRYGARFSATRWPPPTRARRSRPRRGLELAERLPRRQRERRPARTAGHRQDAPLDRARDPCLLAGHRVAFRTATEWVALLADAQHQGRLDAELDKLQRVPLLIVDEVGYIPFDPQAANLMFMLVSRRYERASLIVTSNKPFRAGARSSATRSPPPR